MLASVCTGTAPLCQDSSAKPERPNVLVVIADDCTWSDLGCYGGQAKTPNLDRLCREGMRFDRCFQSAPMCSPTRHSLLTGIHPVRIGAYPNHTFAKKGTRSIAHAFKDAGYRVALWGKRHIAPVSVFPFEYLRANKAQRPRKGALASFVAEVAEKKQPFCAFVCSKEPHSPWNRGDATAYPPEDLKLPPIWVDTPKTRNAYSRYLAEVGFFDRQVGDCLELLEQHDLAANTIVVVLSEQGNSFPFAKWTCYEAGLRSGMIARWPQRVAAASRTTALVQYVDLVPTLLEAIGRKAPENIDGKSFLAVLEGKSKRHADYTFGLQTSRGINHGPQAYGIRSVRDSRYRYIWNLTPANRFRNAAMQSAHWREWVTAATGDERAASLVERYQKRPEVELFDVEADPWCLDNLAGRGEIEDVEARLRARLEAWMKQQGDQGAATEAKAHERQRRGRNKKRRK